MALAAAGAAADGYATATSTRSAGCGRGTLKVRRRRGSPRSKGWKLAWRSWKASAATRAQAAAAQATSRTQVADVETMLREVTATMQAEIVRSSDAQRAHDEAAAAAALQLAEAEREISQLRAAVEAAREAREGTEAQLTARRLETALRGLPPALWVSLHVEAIVTSHPDLIAAAPELLLETLAKIGEQADANDALTAEASALRAESEALMAAHTDAVSKLAGGGVGGGGGGGSVVGAMGSAAMHGASRRRRCSGAGSRVRVRPSVNTRTTAAWRRRCRRRSARPQRGISGHEAEAMAAEGGGGGGADGLVIESAAPPAELLPVRAA